MHLSTFACCSVDRGSTSLTQGWSGNCGRLAEAVKVRVVGQVAARVWGQESEETREGRLDVRSYALNNQEVSYSSEGELLCSCRRSFEWQPA